MPVTITNMSWIHHISTINPHCCYINYMNCVSTISTLYQPTTFQLHHHDSSLYSNYSNYISYILFLCSFPFSFAPQATPSMAWRAVCPWLRSAFASNAAFPGHGRTETCGWWWYKPWIAYFHVSKLHMPHALETWVKYGLLNDYIWRIFPNHGWFIYRGNTPGCVTIIY
jgi:hypothetical protein